MARGEGREYSTVPPRQDFPILPWANMKWKEKEEEEEKGQTEEGVSQGGRGIAHGENENEIEEDWAPEKQKTGLAPYAREGVL